MAHQASVSAGLCKVYLAAQRDTRVRVDKKPHPCLSQQSKKAGASLSLATLAVLNGAGYTEKYLEK
jgi:hypothetical protein